MFFLNEKVVYPGYGVAFVSKLVKKNISGKQASFYELKFFNKDMAVLIPEEKLELVGIRRLSSNQELEEIFDILAKPLSMTDIYNDAGLNVNWNKRNKRYQMHLQSGDLLKIVQIYKDLERISSIKELSFGERNLKSKIEQLLTEEISVVKNIDKKEAFNYLKNNISMSQISVDVDNKRTTRVNGATRIDRIDD